MQHDMGFLFMENDMYVHQNITILEHCRIYKDTYFILILGFSDDFFLLCMLIFYVCLKYTV